MPHVFLERAPDDASQRLRDLKGGELLLFFKSLSWDQFLASHLLSLTTEELKLLLLELRRELSTSLVEKVGQPSEISDTASLLEELRTLYVLPVINGKSDSLTAKAIVGDIERAWSARESDEAGRVEVGKAMNVLFVKENAHKASLPISKALDALKITCTEVKASGRPSRFCTSSTRATQAVKNLLAFCSSSVPTDSVQGLIGRYFEADVEKRRERFQSYWSEGSLSELDSFEAKELAKLLSENGRPISPSASSCRRFLETLAHKTTEIPGNSDDAAADNISIPKLGRAKKGREKKQNHQIRKKLKSNDLVAVSSSSLESSVSVEFGESPFESAGIEFASARESAWSGSRFPALPRKMIQVLKQRGREFEDLFEPLQIEITNTKGLYKLLRYFNDAQRITRELCRASAMPVDLTLCKEKLEVGLIYRIRPEYRLADTLSFAADARPAPRLLHRWMTHGSIIPWLNNLCARAGQIEKDNADGYLARKIMSTGLVLASLLNEFHPTHLIYSNAVEPLVRRLWVTEKSLLLERQERGAYVVKMLGFIGLGNGPILDTEQSK